MRATRPLAVVIGLLLTLCAPSIATATESGDASIDVADVPAANADQVVVAYRDDTSGSERQEVASDLGLTVISSTPDLQTQVVRGRGVSAATVRRLLADDPRVEAVAPNYQRELVDDVTSEPQFHNQWALDNTGQTILGTKGVAGIDIDGKEALQFAAGSPNVVVAVIDDGIDLTHPDLVDAIWTNPGEIPGNGIDDDNDGFIDDVHGWDFCHNDADPSEVGIDWHGTHTAGTIAASLNGVGVVGVAPGVKILPIKAFEHGPNCVGGMAPGSDGLIIAAINYAKKLHVPIINASWGGAGKSAVLDSAVANSGALFVAAAGNNGQNLDSKGIDFYPAETNAANVLSVAAVDQKGAKPSFSNYGALAVDIAAPGVHILSTVPGDYGFSDGTSMAAPHVAGVAALGLSVAPGLTTAALKDRVLSRGTILQGVVGKTLTGRIVDAMRVADVTGPSSSPVNRHGINVGQVIGSSLSTTMVWPPATDDHSGVSSYIVRRRVGTGGWTILDSSLGTTSYKVSLPIGATQQFGVAARDGAGNVGPQAESPAISAVLLQDGTSLAHYSGTWSSVSTSTASNGKLHSSTRAGASVTFTTTARAIALVGRKGPTEGQAKVYVDGVLASTIDLHRSTSQSKVVLFNTSWATNGSHSVQVVVVGTAGHPRVDIDAFAVLR
jgi:subtilisin family serine protease